MLPLSEEIRVKIREKRGRNILIGKAGSKGQNKLATITSIL